MVEIKETLRRPDYNSIATQFDAIMNHQIALHLPVTASDLIHQLQLHKSPSRPDGPCLLHTWEISTGNHIDNIKQMIVNEFSANFQFYQAYLISEQELHRYLNFNNYDLLKFQQLRSCCCRHFNTFTTCYENTRSTAHGVV